MNVGNHNKENRQKKSNAPFAEFNMLTAINDKGEISKKKLGFVWKLVKPDDGDVNNEYQFEEVRALRYYDIYNERQQKIEREKELQAEISELKKKLAEKEKTEENKKSLSTFTESCTNTTVSLKEFTAKLSNKSVATSNELGFNAPSLEHQLDKNKSYACKLSVDDTQFNTTLKPSMSTNTTSIQTPRNITMHTKMARQDMMALFGASSTDTTANTTANLYSDKETTNVVATAGADSHFSIFHDHNDTATIDATKSKINNFDQTKSDLTNKENFHKHNEAERQQICSNENDKVESKFVPIESNRKPLKMVREEKADEKQEIKQLDETNIDQTVDITKFNNRTTYNSKGATTNDFTCVTNMDNFTCVTNMSYLKTPFEKNKTSRFVDEPEFDITYRPPIENSKLPTPRSVTVHTKMARQDMDALFGTTSTDTTVNATVDVHLDKTNTILPPPMDPNFSIFNDPTKAIRSESIFIYDDKKDIKQLTNQQSQKIQEKTLIKETQEAEKIDKDDSEFDNQTVDNKFAALNDQYTAKLCFNPAAMSTRSMKPLFDKMKNFKFDNQTINYDEIIEEVTETSKLVEVKKDVEKMLDEDCQTKYGWSKLINKDELMNRTYTGTQQTPIIESTGNSKYLTSSSSKKLSWDYYKADDGVGNNSSIDVSSKIFSENRAQPLASLKIPESQHQNETFNIDPHKLETNPKNYNLVPNITVDETVNIVELSKSRLHKFDPTNEISQIQIQKSRTELHNTTYSLNTTGVPKVVQPPDLSTTNLLSIVKPPDFSILKDHNQTCDVVEPKKSKLEKTNETKLENDEFSIMDNKTAQLPPLIQPPDLSITTNNTTSLPAVVQPPDFSILKEVDKTADVVEPKKAKLDTSRENDAEEEEDELLTSAKFDETMTTNFKMCFNGTNINLPDSYHQTITTTNFSKYYDLTTKTTNFSNYNDFTTKTTNFGKESANDTILNAILDPFGCDIKNRLLKKQNDYLKNKPNYIETGTNLQTIHPNSFVCLSNAEAHKIIREIGSGAYAKIYLIEKIKQKKRFALKVSQQCTAWEFYVTEVLHERLKELNPAICVKYSYIKLNEFLMYNNGSLSSMNYYKNGTLLDLINYHVELKLTIPYWFSIYLTLELLSIINYLHKCKIIHGDIKPDNLMVNELPTNINYFDPTRTKALVLIDFNRSIDLEMYPDETEFDAKCDNKSLLCCEMKADKPWTYQIDYFGVLSSIHTIIFKKYISTFTENNRFRITCSFPRAYDRLFSSFFDTYLNIPSCKSLPDLETEWIPKFVQLFKTEIVSFPKSEKYINDLANYRK